LLNALFPRRVGNLSLGLTGSRALQARISRSSPFRQLRALRALAGGYANRAQGRSPLRGFFFNIAYPYGEQSVVEMFCSPQYGRFKFIKVAIPLGFRLSKAAPHAIIAIPPFWETHH